MADNGFMIVLDQDFGELPCVWNRFFTDAVLNEGFLEQGVSTIFFVGEDGAQVAGGPVCGSNGVPEPTGHQRQTDIEHGLRRERGRGCAVLLSPLPHGLELLCG